MTLRRQRIGRQRAAVHGAQTTGDVTVHHDAFAHTVTATHAVRQRAIAGVREKDFFTRHGEFPLAQRFVREDFVQSHTGKLATKQKTAKWNQFPFRMLMNCFMAGDRILFFL